MKIKSFRRKIIAKMINIFKKYKIYSYFQNFLINIDYYKPWKIKANLESIYFLSNMIKKGDLCFDIGANVGRNTRKLLRLGAKVISVEPEESNLKKLMLYYKNNKKVIIVPKAIGEKKGIVDFFISEGYETISTLSKNWRTKSRFAKSYTWNKVKKVQMTTIDFLIKKYGLPKFIKIDVEGYEYNVLQGLSRKISYISFEFTKELFNESINCINYLLSLGKAIFNFVIGKNQEFYFNKWVSEKKLISTIFSISNDLLWGDIYVKFL